MRWFEVSSEKVCPLIFSALLAGRPDGLEFSYLNAVCLGRACALWDSKHRRCGLRC